MNPVLASNAIKLFAKVGIGEVDTIIRTTEPGRVKFEGSYWPAKLYNSDTEITIFPTWPVKVIGRQGITLLVIPEDENLSAIVDQAVDGQALTELAIAS
ncbi:MAG: hypothetical protein F6K19_39685 [Cyanothece sp. SIO1E1]|nr:hypothetical protein [Cyanothece sp. SIO1E1]